MSQNAEYKPNSIEDVQKNWIELCLNLIRRKKVKEKTFASKFEEEYGIRLPASMVLRYIRQLESSRLIRTGPNEGYEVQKGSNEAYEITFELAHVYSLTDLGSGRLDYLQRVRRGEKITMKKQAEPAPAIKLKPLEPVITPRREEAFAQAPIVKPIEERKDTATEEQELLYMYRLEVPLILELLGDSRLSGNALKERMDSSLGCTTQSTGFFALLEKLDRADIVRRNKGSESKRDMGKSMYERTEKGSSFLQSSKQM